MSANTNAALASAEPMSLAHLSDAELLTQTRSLVGRSNRLLAELLAHLGEVEARGVHRTQACSSLYTYCIYVLRFSEDEAFRRVAASRLVRRFPALLVAIAAGELHLTGLLMLGPHLTEQNLLQVMARAKHRTKREIARLVRVLDPLPPVPARIEPLGPAPARVVPPEPTWEQFVGALCPVRELEAGERPQDWGLSEEEGECGADSAAIVGHEMKVTARVNAPDSPATGLANTEIAAPARVPSAPVGELHSPQRYKVQFTATEEYAQLVDEAKALLSHSAPRATLEEIQLRAMRAFVAALRKRKYGGPSAVVEAARNAPGTRNAADAGSPAYGGAESPTPARNESTMPLEPPRCVTRAPSEQAMGDVQRTHVGDNCTHASSTAESAASSVDESLRSHVNTAAPSSEPRRRGRYIPAATRRAVATRDGHCCTYVDACGRRCAETQRLEFHHLVPFAVSPSHDATNLTLRCATHNALAAEQDFGRPLVEQRRGAVRHDPLREHEL